MTAHVTQAVAFREGKLAGALPRTLLEAGDVEVTASCAGEHATVDRSGAELFEVVRSTADSAAWR